MGKNLRQLPVSGRTVQRDRRPPTARALQVPLGEQQRYVDLQECGDVAGCVRLAGELTTGYPEAPFAWKALGSALLKAGDLADAEAAIKRALALKPGDPEGHYNLGCIQIQAGTPSQAEHSMLETLSLKGDFEDALLWLTRRYHNAGKYREALELWNRAVALRPEVVAWRKTRAETLIRLGRFTEAVEALEALLPQAQGDAGLLDSLGNGYYNLGRFEEGEKAMAEAERLAPDNPYIHSSHLLLMHYNPDLAPQAIRQAHRDWDAKFRPLFAMRAVTTDADPCRRLRVGMISAGFRIHPVGQMIASSLRFLPREDIELFIYTMNDKVDAYTEVIRQRADHWHSVMTLTDEGLDQRIRDDEIDILVDLAGHTEGSRCSVFAMEPAPLQVKWVGGQINTTGLGAMDYMLSDSVETPPGVDGDYVEKLIRLPDDYICYVPRSDMPDVGPLPALENGFVTFGCFNNPAKINATLIETWSVILQQLPQSRLFLKGSQYDSQELVARLTRLFGEQGIGEERLIFEPRSAQVELLECYNRVDIALDSWPYSGGLTTCEALLMGVPVLTLPGPTFAGRHSATHVTNAGFPEFVVDDWEALTTRALEMAGDLPALAALRGQLRERLLQSPVCHPHRFARNLNIALRAIWQRYCAGREPAPLTFTEDARAYFEGEDTPVVAPISELPDPRARVNHRRPDFDWALPRQIVTVDGGGRLFNDDGLERLLATGGFAVVGFDAAGRASREVQQRQNDRFQLVRHVALGDGAPATLHACLDADLSGLLEPLPQTAQPDSVALGATVLTRLPINTVALDDITDLEHVDWLLLDENCDTLRILRSGSRALARCLVLQLRVLNQPRYQGQASLAELLAWTGANGFELHRIHKLDHAQAGGTAIDTLGATQLEAMDLLFVPAAPRRAALTLAECRLLGCLLQTVYGITDLPHALLRQHDEALAEAFIRALP